MWIEADMYADPGLVVDKYIAFHYTAAMYCSVKKFKQDVLKKYCHKKRKLSEPGLKD